MVVSFIFFHSVIKKKIQISIDCHIQVSSILNEIIIFRVPHGT